MALTLLKFLLVEEPVEYALVEEGPGARPSLLFIDELDALGGARKGFSGNEEREQTLNQLLACMDGFDTTDSGVVVIGATNRFEILDRALCRQEGLIVSSKSLYPTCKGGLRY